MGTDKSLKGVSLSDLLGHVCSHLEKNGIRTVLVGGSVVSVYTQNKYESHDLDLATGADGQRLAAAMNEIGFFTKVKGGKELFHPDTDYYVEFVNPPIRVGGEDVSEVGTFSTARGAFRLLLPTDIIKDRLAAWAHWHDRQSLDQAVLVARDQKVDFEELERWATREGILGAFSDLKIEL